VKNGLREAKIRFGVVIRELNIVAIYGLKKARKILRDIKTIDRSKYDLWKFMARYCGVCQPVYKNLLARKTETAKCYIKAVKL
jgi:NADH-quinone oxidoreductase subunit G